MYVLMTFHIGKSSPIPLNDTSERTLPYMSLLFKNLIVLCHWPSFVSQTMTELCKDNFTLALTKNLSYMAHMLVSALPLCNIWPTCQLLLPPPFPLSSFPFSWHIQVICYHKFISHANEMVKASFEMKVVPRKFGSNIGILAKLLHFK